MIRSLFVLALGALLAAACGGASPPPGKRDHGGPCVNVGDICHWAGSGTAGWSGDGGPADEADFYLPMDVTFGPDGAAYVVDWNNHRIRRISADGSRVETVAGSGEFGDQVGDALLLETSFNHPTHAQFDAQGRLVIAAWHNSRIKRLDLATGVVENIAGVGKRDYFGDGGPANAAALDLPTAVAFGPDGALYVMDQANQLIRRIGSDGIISTYAGVCTVEDCAVDATLEACPGSNKRHCGGVAEAPTLCAAKCIAGSVESPATRETMRMFQGAGQATEPGGRMVFDAAGNLFFADRGNNVVRRIAPDGTVTTVAGNGLYGGEGDGLPATEAPLMGPADVEIGPDGDLYFTVFGAVRAVDANGIIRTVAGQGGVYGSAGDGGPATSAALSDTFGIAFDARGDLYVVDTGNSRIRRVKRVP